MSEKSDFIKATAKDYDIGYETVEKFYDTSPVKEGFYEKLEGYIKERASKNCAPCPIEKKPCDSRQVDCPNAVNPHTE